MTPKFESVEISCPGVVPKLDVFFGEIVVLEVVLENSVSSESHESELLLCPRIHRKTSDVGNIDSHGPVKGCAVHANEDSVVDTGPLRVHSVAVKAVLVFWLKLQLLEDQV